MARDICLRRACNHAWRVFGCISVLFLRDRAEGKPIYGGQLGGEVDEILHDFNSMSGFLFAVVMLTLASGAMAGEAGTNRTIQVSGTGTDLLNGAIVHSKTATPSGVIQHGTEIVELNGDLAGKVLYHVTTVIDNQKGTLTNTGEQVFSGTVKGSQPVMIRDSRFRFDVNLATGAETGSVYLFDHIAGPRVRCELKVTGTGKTADGNPTFSYTGRCRFGRAHALAAGRVSTNHSTNMRLGTQHSQEIAI